MTALQIFHELHIDDFFLEQQPGRERWQQSRRIIDALCDAAEARGHRLAIRFRYGFAEAALQHAAADNPLRAWEERGHEVGTHAHFRQIRRAKRAIDACGVQDNRCVVPGFIAADPARVRRIAAACRHLGFRYITDQVHTRPFPYVGFVPWRMSADCTGVGDGPFLMLDVSVNPRHWGLIETDASGVVSQRFGLGPDNFERLLELVRRFEQLPRPHPVCYFGYTFHDHQFARSIDDPRLDEAAVQAWSEGFLARLDPAQACLPRDLYAQVVALEGEPPQERPGPATRLAQAVDRRDRRFDVPSYLRERLRGPPRTLREVPPPPRRPLRALRHRLQPEGGQERWLQVGSRRVHAREYPASDPRAVVVFSTAGHDGGTEIRLSLLGCRMEDLLARGLSVWLYDRAGTGRTGGDWSIEPGAPHHAEDAAAVFAAARARGLPTGWLTWSGGVLAPLMALDRARPDFFVDVEGPADRLSLVRRAPLGSDLAQLERTHRDELYSPAPEPWRLLAELPCAYHRVQGWPDHMHGRTALHARVMLDAAPGAAFLNGRPWNGVLPTSGRPIDELADTTLAVLESVV